MTVSLNWLLRDPSEIYCCSEADKKSELTIYKEVEKDENQYRGRVCSHGYWIDDEALKEDIGSIATNKVVVVAGLYYFIIII